MKLLVFGQTGQVARELLRRCPTAWHITALSRDAADLTDPIACAAQIAASDADVVINAAAYTAVDRAEADEATAFTVNAISPGAMATAAAARGMPFIHISTDYVFDGHGATPWLPDDPTVPQGAYGRTKLAGEDAVRAAGGRHVILRTSWVFSVHGNNFVKTMLRLGAARDSLNVVCDQIGGPTSAADISDAIFAVIGAFQNGQSPNGTHHFSGAPDTSWANFARAIFAQAGVACVVNDIPVSDYPTPAARPANSRLDCSSLRSEFGISRPEWRTSLADVLSDLQKETE
jgi:dTDP-4-dehydrorhamnose reductase